ncbi:MAG: hypothetical protein KGD59_04100 [Candidatus Heimdallarchaeota archaeon]|nr:hypothetical protein [Candidatus Heimdallarchaeota archaeon]MBY8993708.1 hypothetical protein [Candidatus Heimdallarchaeota archaeon]
MGKKPEKEKRKESSAISEEESPIKEKYRVDTAGTLFSLASSPKIPCVYRFWATLKELVKANDLQQALDNILPRFPYYQVKFSRGFLWYKWKTTTDKPQVIKEPEYPCQHIPIKSTTVFPFRVIANYNQIMVEFHHSLTDGFAALIFLKALITEYLRIQGHVIDDWGDVFRADQTPDPKEFEYSYRKNFKIGIPKVGRIFPAFHLPYDRVRTGVSHVINGKMDVNDVLQVAKEWKVTLTEFLTAVYIDVLQKILFNLPRRKSRRLKRPIRIMLPINARNIIPSKTMRNFTTFIYPGIDPRLGEFTFEEIIERVHHYKYLNLTEKSLIQQISNFVALAANPALHITPYFLKLLLIIPIYRRAAEALFSAFLTNMGRTSMPIQLSDEVVDIQLLPMTHHYFKSSCAMLTYFDELNINFVRNVNEKNVEEMFFNRLKEFGIDVKVTEIL